MTRAIALGSILDKGECSMENISARYAAIDTRKSIPPRRGNF